jgi:hypothetical protein
MMRVAIRITREGLTPARTTAPHASRSLTRVEPVSADESRVQGSRDAHHGQGSQRTGEAAQRIEYAGMLV